MTSSVLDGNGAGSGCTTPAPPAFSPLTDPAPDFVGSSDLAAPAPMDIGTHDPEHLPDAPPAQHDVTTTPVTPARVNVGAGAGTAENSHRDGREQAAIPPSTPSNTQEVPPPAAEAMANPLHLGSAMDTSMYYSTNPALDVFTPHPTQLLMALARLSAQQQQNVPQPPSTVRPSQVSLPPPTALDISEPMLQQAPDGSGSTPPADAPLESFAKIEFADSVFEMTTYAVIIGRDQRALDQARRDERRHDDYQRRVRENEQLGLPAPSPPSQDRGKFSKSYVSEEGGMLGPESDGDENPRPSKRRKTSGGAASGSGDSHQLEPAGPDRAVQDEKHQTLNRQYVSHTPGAAAVNLSALRPSPHYVPFIGIHSPGPNIASRTKAISREHLKIEFNQKQGVFEAIPLHKNGFFCEDVLYKDQKVVLRSGDRLQIKDVEFVFIINGVPRGKTGAEDGIDEDGVSSRRYSEGGKEMSFDFESTHDHERRSTSPEEVPAQVAKEESDSELSDPAEDLPEPEPEDAPEQDVMETIEKDHEVPPTLKPDLPPELYDALGPIPQRKRGPGRPPKNGIMSKREERLRRKAAMELAKKNMPLPPPGEPPIKRKVGRPRKHPLPENAPDRPEKRKYKPRKSKNGEEGEGSDLEKTIKERRREKPKTPPLELNEADYTEEQRQKPPKNYGTLIDEVLTAAPDGLTLKQIYKRIQMKYPYFYFHVESKGWESSVRHNLIGNDAFKKNEETHLWSRVPGIDIDAGKKRKATSPERSTSMHTFGPPYSTAPTATSQVFHAEPGAQHGYRPGSAPQRTYPPGHGQLGFGQLPHAEHGAAAVAAAAQQAARSSYPTTAQAPVGTPTAGYVDPATARPSPGNAHAAAYSSPYATKPPSNVAGVRGSAAQIGARQDSPHTQSLSPFNGLPRAGPSPTQTTHSSAGSRLPQPAHTGAPVALKPAVAPELVKHVTNFKKTVTEQLAKRTQDPDAAAAIAMSVIHRGLGLTTESMIPEAESLEKIVFGVFESTSKNLGANGSLHPGLLQALVKFKNNMIQTLEARMKGKRNAERLILSAVNRVLGFADCSTMPGTEAEKKQYEAAETVLITAIERVVTEHQKTVAALASVAAPQPTSRPSYAPSPTPAPGSSSIPAKAQTPAPPSAPAYSTTAPPNSGIKPAYPAPASTSPPVAAPAGLAAAHPATTASAAQQAPRPTIAPTQHVSQPAAAPAIQNRAPAPVPGTVQNSALGTGQSPNPARTQAAVPAQIQGSTPAAVQVQGATPAQVPAQTVQQPPPQRPVQVQTPLAGLTPTPSQPPSQDATAPVAPSVPAALKPQATTSQLGSQGAFLPNKLPALTPSSGLAPVPAQRPSQSSVPGPSLSAAAPTASTTSQPQNSSGVAQVPIQKPVHASATTAAPSSAPVPPSSQAKTAPQASASQGTSQPASQAVAPAGGATNGLQTPSAATAAPVSTLPASVAPTAAPKGQGQAQVAPASGGAVSQAPVADMLAAAAAPAAGPGPSPAPATTVAR